MKRSNSLIIYLLSTLIYILLLSNYSYAGSTGRIAGKVSDALTGEPLVGANLIIRAQIVNGREINIPNIIGASSDISGDYFMINIRPGTYVVECSYIGYQKLVQKDVIVLVDRTTSLDFSINEQLIEGDEVVVQAQKPLVRRDLTSASAKVSGETIKNLPVESFQEVLSLQSGVTTGINGGLHIRGGRSSEIKYYVDGSAVSNPFTNSLAVPVENNAIQEVEVISGTFNAEYGQAQSGIINIVTKEGTDELTGSISGYVGDFLSTHDKVFLNINDVNPLSQKYFEADLSGPLFSSKLNFFVSARFTELENYLYGQRVFLPIDSSNFAALDPENWYIESSGDSQFVPMRNSQDLSGNVKLTYYVIPELKVSYSLIANISESKSYSHQNRLNPDSRPTSFNESFNHMLSFTHTLSPSAFYTLKFSMYSTDLERYVHKDPFDIGYLAVYNRNRQPSSVFSTGGIDAGHLYRKSKTYAVKADLNWQLDKYNYVKIGAEYRSYDLDRENFVVDVNPNVYGSYERVIPPLTSTNHDLYKKKPLEISAYVQDKIEIKDLTVNAGVRFDYFDAKSIVPTDFRDPANKLFPSPVSEAYADVKVKTQISPRLGLAFPITDKGVVHAAYGLFFQIPEFDRLYENPEFEVLNESFIGNADLEAQRTDMYELGLQQQLAEFLAVDITAYYRNIRNLLGSTLYKTYRTDLVYGRYVNNSHGAVRGLSIATKIRVPDFGLVADFNYTYQVAKGIASDPKQEFNDLTGKNEAAIVLNPLAWDLRHSFNFLISYSKDSWGASIIGRLNTGYPFTPNGFIELRNQGRYQGDFNIDLNASKQIAMGDLNIEIFARVMNLLDRQRIDLFPEIRPEDEAIHEQNGFNRFNTLYELNLAPQNQPAPREVRFGARLIF